MSNYSIFSVLGIEIEYMLVDKLTLMIQPKSDIILGDLSSKGPVNEVILGDIAASNEFVLHLIELKNNGPKPITYPMVQHFQQAILHLQPFLTQYHLQLLPTGAHPFMDPLLETKRWPHGNSAIYKQYDSIFNCKGHGWANLQSMHINLPFANDEEFCQLHNTIRLLLPILPAMAASTPILGGVPTGMLDSRLEFYGKNQQRIPSIAGDIIPDFISTQEQYQHEILQPMFHDINDLDPEKVLQHEWLNSRAAIPKFEYNAIEIRILDTQECVKADIAIAKTIFAILKSWYESGSPRYREDIYPTPKLRAIFDQTIKDGLDVIIADQQLLEQWQLPSQKAMTLRDVWSLLIERISPDLDHETQHVMDHILKQGNLSERILRACGTKFSQEKLVHVYQHIGDCLANNQQFQPS